MAEHTLLLASILAAGAAGIYLLVGHRVGQRPVAGDAQVALRSFSIWWYALGASTLTGAVGSLAAWGGAYTLPLALTLNHLNLLLVCIALWGLLYYLLFLFTGRKDLLVPLSGVYVLYYLGLVYVVTAAGPIGVEVGAWSQRLAFAQPITGSFATLLVALLVVPQILGALAYFTLYFKAADRSQRYRIAVVSWSIVLWFGSSIAASAAGLAQEDWWQVASRGLGLGAALAILAAYHPPRVLRMRFGLAAVDEVAPLPPPPPASKAPADPRLRGWPSADRRSAQRRPT